MDIELKLIAAAETEVNQAIEALTVLKNNDYNPIPTDIDVFIAKLQTKLIELDKRRDEIIDSMEDYADYADVKL